MQQYQDIQTQFDKVIKYSQGFTPDTDSLFQRWYEAKQHIINAWHGNLIVELEEPIYFTPSEDDKKRAIGRFDEWLYHNGRNDALRAFILENYEGFYDNLVIHDYQYAPDKTIPKGMKLAKAFKYFISDEDFLAKVQNKMSAIIQESKVCGKLCLSVHPLDFLSSSENTYNWRSCHALDGEFRCGNLSYMVDSCTVMCYLRGADNVELRGFGPDVPWNSKKWRMLMFFSEDGDHIMAGRQYPFFCKSALDKVLKLWCATKGCSAGEWTNWTNWNIDHCEVDDDRWNDIYLRDRYVVMHERLHKMHTIVKDADHSLHFNDLLNSSCYVPYYTYREVYHVDSKPRWIIGGAVDCLCCGDALLYDGERMCCSDCDEDQCEDIEYCHCCGSRIYNFDEAAYSDNYEAWICNHCRSSAGHCCAECGEWFFDGDLHYDQENNVYRCYGCYSLSIPDDDLPF
jgi:hypothetical protein